MISDIRKNIAANKHLRDIAEGKSRKSLTRDEARRIVELLDWLSKERSALIDSLPCDD